MHLPRWLYAGLFPFLVLVSGQDGSQCNNVNVKADVWFLLDSSGSIGYQNFQTMLKFIVNITDDFKVGPDDMQFGVMIFSHTAHIIFDLNTYDSNSGLERGILNTSYIGGGTATYDGLRLLREEAFTPARGTRPDVSHIVIVATDGQSANMSSTAEEAALLKNTGVIVMSIGIGLSVNDLELRAIASSPENVFLASNFDGLDSIKGQVSNRTCIAGSQCNLKADIWFLLDSSGSIGFDNFQKMLKFIINITNDFKVGPNDVQFGVMIFSSAAIIQFNLSSYDNHNGLEMGILNTSYIGGGTATYDGLRLLREEAFTPARGTRSDVLHIVIVATDGQSANMSSTAEEAALLKNTGVIVMSIGIGDSVNESELKSIASSPENVFLASDFDGLDSIKEQVSNRTCTADDQMCHRTIDLVFVIDGSNSLQVKYFLLMIDTISKVVNGLKFGEEEARVGAVLYSTNVTGIVELNTNKTDFISKILKFDYPGEATNTHLGIAEATRILTENPRNISNIPKTMFILTDGASTNRYLTEKEARLASDKGIDIWAVGVGDQANMNELARIATNGDNQTFSIENFDVLSDRLQNLTQVVCKKTGTIVPKPDHDSARSTDYNEICIKSQSIGGVGHVPYPGEDCTKVLQCYYNPHTKKTLVVTRQCPFGQFWDQSCLKCVDSWKVHCPYDKCRTGTCGSCETEWYGTGPYPMEGVCGGFWSCNQGRSYPECCLRSYSFVPGYGCRFGQTCMDKCPPEETCAEGLGWCEKLPVWENEATYAVASSSLGLNPTTCSQSNFSIVECRCQIDPTEIFMQGESVCLPYYESNTWMLCSPNVTQIPIKQENDIADFVWKIRLNVAEPKFEILSIPSPTTNCDQNTRLRVWADDAGVQAQIGRANNTGPVATVLFKGWSGELDVLVSLHQGVLRLTLTKDNYIHVASVKAPSLNVCTDSVHDFSLIPSDNAACSINQIQLYNCRAAIRDIY